MTDKQTAKVHLPMNGIAPMIDRNQAHATTVNPRIGRIEMAILAELRAAGGASGMISDHGPSTGRAIDRLEAKGWIVVHANRWSVADAAPRPANYEPELTTNA